MAPAAPDSDPFSRSPVARYRCAFDMDWTGDFAGDAVADITGYPGADFVDGGERTWMSIVCPEDRTFLLAVAREAVATREPFGIEYRIINARGELRRVAERGCAIFADGAFSHFEGEIVALD